ncbi:hypothetical protein [Rhodovarius sp.]
MAEERWIVARTRQDEVSITATFDPQSCAAAIRPPSGLQASDVT